MEKAMLGKTSPSAPAFALLAFMQGAGSQIWRRKRNGGAPGGLSTSVIDQGCDFEGRLSFVGTLVLNGKFRGEIVTCDTLLVGESGEIEAEVRVGTAIVSGQITGNLVARERIELRAGARVSGEIVTPVLVLEEGVVFDGRCKMKGEEVEAAQESS
jgi:cytoskeletal protein CcmA (bactofilin family)